MIHIKDVLVFILIFILLSLTQCSNVHGAVTEVTYEEAQMLMKVAQAEAGNQGIKGMAYVMRVVLNRVKSDDFPNTVKEVIEQPYQFESFSNGAYQDAEPTADCHLALADVEREYINNKNIIAFEYTGNGDTLLKYFDYSFTDNSHHFYVRKED